MFYCVIVTLTFLAFHVVFRIKVIGKENLIRDRGFVLAPNHISALDPVFVVIARFWGKRMLIMGKKEVFEVNPVFSWMFRHVGVVPVDRGRGDTELLDQIIAKVKAGRGALIFPEGTRSKTGELGKLKTGVFMIANSAQADIIPCRIIYKGGKMKLFGRCTIVFGKPIAYADFAMGETRNLSGLRQAKNILQTRLDELLQENAQYQ